MHTLRGSERQEQQLHSKFLAAFACNTQKTEVEANLNILFFLCFQDFENNFISNTGGKQSYQLASYIWILLRSVCREDLCAIV